MSSRMKPLPKVAPVIPIERTHPFDDPGFLFEPKFDGFRAILCIDGDEASFTSKRGRPLTRFAALAAAIRKKLGVASAILDGEVAAVDEEGRINFSSLMSGRGDLHYAAFDLLWLNGSDLREKPLSKRRPLLHSAIGDTTPILSHIFGTIESGRDLFQVVTFMDLEGIVAKRLADPYDATTVWYKIKNRKYSQMTERRFERFSRKS